MIFLLSKNDKIKWQEFLKTIDAYLNSEPYGKIANFNFFGIKKSDWDDAVYCFLGHERDSFMLYICRGDEALFRVFRSFFKTKNPLVDSMYDMDCLYIGFVPANKISEYDYKFLEELNYIKENKGNGLLPHFKSFSSGYEPWGFEISDLDFCKPVIEILTELTDSEIMRNVDLGVNKSEIIPVFMQTEQDSLKWRIARHPLSHTLSDLVCIEPDDDGCLKQIKKGCAKKGRLIAGVYYSPVPINRENSGRHIFPRVYFIGDFKTNELLSYGFFENMSVDGYKIVDSLTTVFQERKEIPRTILVRNEETFCLLEKTCEMFKISLKFTNKTVLMDDCWINLEADFLNEISE